MPIPGPSPTVDLSVDPIPTGSPFYLGLHGAWYQLEGVTPGVGVTTERPRSSVTSIDGRRFEQRARLARRSWEVALPYASAANLAALRVAADSDDDVWLLSEPVASGNMLGNRDCFGTGAVVDCAGLSLPAVTSTPVQIPMLRGGVPVTLSAWTTAAEGEVLGGVAGYTSSNLYAPAGVGARRASVTFTPTADVPAATLHVTPDVVAGLMLTEGDPAEVFIPGESMPCKVVVDDPGDVLSMLHRGTWRHEYSVVLREVG